MVDIMRTFCVVLLGCLWGISTDATELSSKKRPSPERSTTFVSFRGAGLSTFSCGGKSSLKEVFENFFEEERERSKKIKPLPTPEEFQFTEPDPHPLLVSFKKILEKIYANDPLFEQELTKQQRDKLIEQNRKLVAKAAAKYIRALLIFEKNVPLPQPRCHMSYHKLATSYENHLQTFDSGSLLCYGSQDYFSGIFERQGKFYSHHDRITRIIAAYVGHIAPWTGCVHIGENDLAQLCRGNSITPLPGAKRTLVDFGFYLVPWNSTSQSTITINVEGHHRSTTHDLVVVPVRENSYTGEITHVEPQTPYAHTAFTRFHRFPFNYTQRVRDCINSKFTGIYTPRPLKQEFTFDPRWDHHVPTWAFAYVSPRRPELTIKDEVAADIELTGDIVDDYTRITKTH